MFLHFFDSHFLDEKGEAARSEGAQAEMDLAVRFAIILSYKIFVPAASFYENPIARRVLAPYAETSTASQFMFVGSGSSAAEFVDEKRSQYATNSSQFAAYDSDLRIDFPWLRRKQSATRDIKRSWRLRAETSEVREQFTSNHLIGSDDRFAAAWEDLPDRLGSAPFIVENVLKLLPVQTGNLVVVNKLHGMINEDYFRSFVTELKASVFRDMAWLDTPDLPSGNPEEDISYGMLVKVCRQERILDAIMSAHPSALDEFLQAPAFNNAFFASQTAGLVTPELGSRKLESPVIELRANISNSIQVSTVPNVPALPTGPAAQNASTSVSGGKVKVDLAIITALPKEREAVMAVFGNGRPLQVLDDSNMYALIEAKFGSAKRRIVVATLSQMGNANAAVVTANTIRSFDFDFAALVGIAGGIPTPKATETHMRLGDVVISNKVVEYDQVKDTGQLEYRDSAQSMGYQWLQSAIHLKKGKTGFDEAWRHRQHGVLRKHEWPLPDVSQDILYDLSGEQVKHPEDKRRSKGPLVHMGLIGAGDTLLKNNLRRDLVGKELKVQAVEMEGAGFRQAAWAGNAQVINIRGIVDYCDTHKDDDWHMSAAVGAASVCRALFNNIMVARDNGQST